VSAAENLSAQVYFQGRNAMSKLRKKHFAMAVFPQQHFFGMIRRMFHLGLLNGKFIQNFTG
jgi:hypothetical protein